MIFPRGLKLDTFKEMHSLKLHMGITKKSLAGRSLSALPKSAEPFDGRLCPLITHHEHNLHISTKGGKNFTNALANLASAWSSLTDTSDPAKETEAHITSANESALYILKNPSGLYNRSIIERDPSEGQLDSLKNPFLRSLNATQKKRAGATLSELLTNAKRLQSASNPMEVTRLQKTQDELINDIKAILLKEDLANHSYSRAVKMLLEKNLPCAVSDEVLTMIDSKYPKKSTDRAT